MAWILRRMTLGGEEREWTFVGSFDSEEEGQAALVDCRESEQVLGERLSAWRLEVPQDEAETRRAWPEQMDGWPEAVLKGLSE